MILGVDEARALTTKILALSKADSCLVTITGGDERYVRFAQNMATTAGAPASISVSVQSNFGLRSGSASGGDLRDDALAALVAESEHLAKLAPENPEFMPPLGPQTYVTGSAFSPATQSTTSAALAASVQPTLAQAEAKGLQASGYVDLSTGFTAFATSAGLYAYDVETSALHTVTARTPDGTGSGWAGTTHCDFTKMDMPGLGATAIDKALRSQKPVRLEPGKYTVILDPSAVFDLMNFLIGYFDQRAADEGRSFATKKGGGSRVGEQVFGKNITLYSDPNDPLVPGSIFSDDGAPSPRMSWIENGILKALPCSRYWAKKTKGQFVPGASSLCLVGGTSTTADLVKQVKRGLLITRFWYIREVDPQTVLLTGLTRDGVFLIENGEMVKPTCNFRFNESPVAMLNKVIAMGPSVRSYGDEASGLPIAVPQLLVDEFTLSSVSDAV
jgi:predicted Zn-dependent protease